MALSADGRHWFLVNASPDLRSQLETFAPLQPAPAPPRNSPLAAILLTNPDLDHTAGLLLLREGEPLHLHTSAHVRAQIEGPLGFASLLRAYCGIVWHDLPVGRWEPLVLASGQPSGLACRALPLRSPPSRFAAGTSPEDQTTALLFRDERTGGVLLLAPDVFELSPELAEAVMQADAVLFDGTFWSEDELGTVRKEARPSSAMGHLPIRDGSLGLLARSPARHRIYLHINNTNPILIPGSAERRAVEEAGLCVGEDGMEFEL